MEVDVLPVGQEQRRRAAGDVVAGEGEEVKQDGETEGDNGSSWAVSRRKVSPGVDLVERRGEDTYGPQNS